MLLIGLTLGFGVTRFAFGQTQVESVPSIWTIRQIASLNGEGIVQKFEDGPNTCYVATNTVHSYTYGNTVAISCVKR